LRKNLYAETTLAPTGNTPTTRGVGATSVMKSSAQTHVRVLKPPLKAIADQHPKEFYTTILMGLLAGKVKLVMLRFGTDVLPPACDAKS